MDCAAHSNKRCVFASTRSSWTPAYSRPCYRRHNAGVEHALLEQLTLFPNATIVLEDVDTHRSTLGRGTKMQTPESENTARRNAIIKPATYGRFNDRIASLCFRFLSPCQRPVAGFMIALRLGVSRSGTLPAFTCDCMRFVTVFTRRRKFDLCVSTM